MSRAPGLYERSVQYGVNVFCIVPFQEFDHFFLDYPVEVVFSDFAVNLLRTLRGYAASPFLMRHNFLSRWSVSSSLVFSLRLRTPFILMMMNVLKTPNRLLGCLPGPIVWKPLSNVALAKLKSTFLKRVSRVSCSSCPANGFTS